MINVKESKKRKTEKELNIDDFLLQLYDPVLDLSTCETSCFSNDASHKSVRNLLNDSTKKMELNDLLECIGIDIKERQKIIDVLTKKNLQDSNDFLEFMDDDLQSINC